MYETIFENISILTRLIVQVRYHHVLRQLQTIQPVISFNQFLKTFTLLIFADNTARNDLNY